MANQTELLVGPDLDAAIARRVFGEGPGSPYSQSLEHAMELAYRFPDLAFALGRHPGGLWAAAFSDAKSSWSAEAATPAEAICRAALRVLDERTG